MPKNNGKTRKLQRQVNADAIKAQSVEYPCGHKHVTQEQAMVCPSRVRFDGNY